jgi:hypothetical protein
MKTALRTNLLGVRPHLQRIGCARRAFTTTVVASVFIAAAVYTAPLGRAAPANKDKFIVGETATIVGGEVSTWARVNGGDKVIWVGLTLPLAMVENMPAPGSGPAGAVAVLNFPPVVQATTYFNHVEIQSNQHGHVSGGADPHRYEAPHFDLHFYGIPVAQVQTIPGGLFFIPIPANRLPDGYAQAEFFSIPQMGRHSSTPAEVAATDHWLYSMHAGFLPNASYMHFVEPMVTREMFLRRKNFELPVPTPAVLGRATNYPTEECVILYDKSVDAFHIVFKGFEPIE